MEKLDFFKLLYKKNDIFPHISLDLLVLLSMPSLIKYVYTHTHIQLHIHSLKYNYLLNFHICGSERSRSFEHIHQECDTIYYDSLQ